MITNIVNAYQLLLIGNPNPLTLDANVFIGNNNGFTDTSTLTPSSGSSYLWDHDPCDSNHNLGGYQKAYAFQNANIGFPPTSAGVDFINTAGVFTRIAPNQYISVAKDSSLLEMRKKK